MGVYGDMLLFWPEQYRSGTYFNQDPLVDNGYTRGDDPPDETPIIGIFQNNASDVHDGEGNLVKKQGLYLWVQSALTLGWFVRFEDVIYRIITGNDWPTEGGFYEYGIERLVGSNGDESEDPAVTTGSNFLS